MRTLLVTLIASSSMLFVVPAHAEEKPPNRQSGCCFHFSDSPVNIIFCSVPDSCKFQGGDPK